MTLLYRGVSREMDSRLSGQLRPKGNRYEIVPRYDGKPRYDGTFTYGESEDNAVRAQQIESGLYEGCYISTTKNEDQAIYFATTNFCNPGWVYVLDSKLFEEYGVKKREFDDPRCPKEEEVTIRSKDCGIIPQEVIIEKYEVDSTGTKTKPPFQGL